MAIKFLNTVAVDADVLYVDTTNDRVGIGTPSPDDKLHVNQGSDAFRGITIEGTSPGLYLKDTQATNAHHIGSNGNYLYFLEDSNQSGGYNNILAFWDPSNNFVFQTGNVGIGATSPGAKLHILSSTTNSFDQVVKLSGQVGVGGGPAVFFKTSGADSDDRYGVKLGAVRSDSDNGSSIFKIQQELSNSAGTLLGLTDTFTINQYGNVGIGTTSPGVKLDVSDIIRGRNSIRVDGAITGSPYFGLYQGGEEKAYIQYVDSGDNLVLQSDGIFTFKTATAERVRITAGGLVGIGTTSPTAKLHVLGSSSNDSTTKAEMLSNSAFSVRPHSSNSGTLAIAQVDGGNSVGMQFTNGAGTSNWDISMQPFGGNVGIGTTSPSEKLEVVGNIKTSGTGNTQVILESGGACVMDLLNAQSEAYLRTTTAHDLHFRTTNLNRMVIKAAGNVGIGTTSPGYPLEISNNAITSLVYQRTGVSANKWGFHSDNDATYWQNVTSGSLLFTLQNGGNVGIGTTSPAAKLHVVENTQFASGQASVEVLRLQRKNTAGDIKATTEGHISMWATDSNNDTEWGRISWVNDNTQDGGLETEGAMSFSTSREGTLTRAMYIDHNQNVGIGTTSPSEKLDVVGNIELNGVLYVGSRGIYQQQNTDVSGLELVANASTSLYRAAFFDYVIQKAGNVRAGTVFACNDGGSVEYTETSTNDIGDTSDVVLSVDISGGNMRLLADAATSGWSVKSLIRAI